MPATSRDARAYFEKRDSYPRLLWNLITKEEELRAQRDLLNKESLESKTRAPSEFVFYGFLLKRRPEEESSGDLCYRLFVETSFGSFSILLISRDSGVTTLKCTLVQKITYEMLPLRNREWKQEFTAESFECIESEFKTFVSLMGSNFPWAADIIDNAEYKRVE